MILRASKFFGFCYADELAESEFFAKNFKVAIQEKTIIMSFDWMRGLDLKKITPQLTAYLFFEIEDIYLRNKLIAFVTENSGVKKMKLEVGVLSTFIKNIKFTTKGFIIQLVK